MRGEIEIGLNLANAWSQTFFVSPLSVEEPTEP
jgi:hypothetical protein